MTRLQKFMAEAGVASRRKCEEYIAEGRVKVNGRAASIGSCVEEGDLVELDGRPLGPARKRVYVMLNKPRGVVCTCSDPQGRKTAAECVKGLGRRLYSVGRLDRDSEGLIVLTDDGELAYRMTHPKFAVDKTYRVTCGGRLTRRDIDRLESGVELEDGPASPAGVENVEYAPDGSTAFDITIHEGRNREIRRMLSALGHATLLLRRIREGPLELGGLKTGRWRHLTPEELSALGKIR